MKTKNIRAPKWNDFIGIPSPLDQPCFSRMQGETLQGGVTGNQIRSPRLANLSQNLSGGQGKARRTVRISV